MATTAAAPTAPSVSTPSYLQLYSTTNDSLNGNYTQLYTPHHVTNGYNNKDLLEMAVSSSQHIPKVYLAHVTTPSNRHCILAFHRPSAFTPDLLEPMLKWDNKNFIFASDVPTNGSNFIHMRG